MFTFVTQSNLVLVSHPEYGSGFTKCESLLVSPARDSKERVGKQADTSIHSQR